MANHLVSESSPYLQQHADNPVDWHPWSEQALALARKQDKPILLSIGYSTCHWRHVMAHESFEDQATADLINRDFIAIKVDRDEARYNRPGFKDLLPQVAQAYRERRHDIAQQNISLLESLTSGGPVPQAGTEPGPAPLASALSQLEKSFDPVHGGFGGAPKFPRPSEIAFCLRRYAAEGNGQALEMARQTLRKIADGGINDQLGGGFCRYSVDERWLIPHFEKMLYDNGPLLELYADAWRCGGDERFRTVAEQTVAWLEREMRAQRVRPGRDEKVLTSWNALTIKGLAHAGRAFGREDWIVLAQQAVDFIRSELWRDNRLLASWKDGKANLGGYLYDYAFQLDALMELMQARFRTADLAFACELAEALLGRFEDRDQGGFYFTAHDHETLIYRPKSGFDNATPSGNAVAAFALQRLGHLLGEIRYLAAAERALKLFYPQIIAQPAGFMSFLAVLEEYLEPPQIVILRGPAEPVAAWQITLSKEYRPTTMVLALPGELENLPGSLDKPATLAVNAWVCQGVKCLPAISDVDILLHVCKTGKIG